VASRAYYVRGMRQTASTWSQGVVTWDWYSTVDKAGGKLHGIISLQHGYHLSLIHAEKSLKSLAAAWGWESAPPQRPSSWFMRTGRRGVEGQGRRGKKG